MSGEFITANAVWPRLNVTFVFASSRAGCEAAGDIAGTVAAMTDGDPRVESEKASYNTLG
jgi:hypothetical protein